MTKTILLGITLAAVFVVSMMMLPASAGGHLAMIGSTVYQTGTGNAVIAVMLPIPTDGSLGSFGFAFPLTDGSGCLLAAATHGAIGDDSSRQNPNNLDVMHTHIVCLGAVPAATCSSLTAITSATKNEVGKATVSDNFLILSEIPVGIANAPLSFPLSAPAGAICVG